jgi:isocitrate dehydrogenase
MRGPWGSPPDPADNFITPSDTEGKVALFETLVPPAVEKGIEAAIAGKTVTRDFARLMRAEGEKDVQEVKCSGFADAVIASM